MRTKPWLIWLWIIAVAIVSYGVSYFLCVHRVYEMARCGQNELEWLRREYHLTDDQFQHIRALHENQMKLCEEMCQKVDASNKILENLIRSNSSLTPEIKEALAHSRELESECEQATLEHIYQVGAIMNSEDGKRFVEEMSHRLLHPSASHSAHHFDSSNKMHE